MEGLSQIGLGLASIKGGSDLIGGGLALGGLSLVDGPASPATAATAAGAVTVGSGMVLASFVSSNHIFKRFYSRKKFSFIKM